MQALSQEVEDILARQAILLSQINGLEPIGTHNGAYKGDMIGTLKQEYNELIDRRASLVRRPLSDPLQALPPELWPDIIGNILHGLEYPVDLLLELTMVSQTWHSILVSMPTLWTNIRLDPMRTDYLSKAVTGLWLSRGCEIDLSIHLPLNLWADVSAIFVSEYKRVRSLSLKHIGNTESIQIFGYFPGFPALRNIYYYSVHRRKDISLNDQLYRALGVGKMPLLESVVQRDTRALYLPTWSNLWSRLITRLHLYGNFIEQDLVMRLGHLPRLFDFTLVEFSRDIQSLELLPSDFDSSLASVFSFIYRGSAVYRSLKWIGHNLTDLDVQTFISLELNEFPLHLSRFQNLRRLSLYAPTFHWDRLAHNSTAITLSSLKSLTLGFDNALDHKDRMVTTSALSLLITTFPYINEFSILKGVLNDQVACCIENLANLHRLSMEDVLIDPAATFLSISLGRIRRIQCVGIGFLALLARLYVPDLHRLEIGNARHDWPSSLDQQDLQIIKVPQILEKSFVTITSLTINVCPSLVWELGLQPNLRELILQSRSNSQPSLYWVSDLFEGILIRPGDTPALRKITLEGEFLEWDILLLMVERKNVLAGPGVIAIEAIAVDYELPYKLLYPLSELLQGKLIERDTRRFLSLDTIGQQLLNPCFPGCRRCIYALHQCDKRSMPGRPIQAENHGLMLELDYDLPSEILKAEPPLPPDMAQWLSGKRQRRRDFVQRYKETTREFHRAHCCGHLSRYQAVTITGSSLKGVVFESDEGSA